MYIKEQRKKVPNLISESAVAGLGGLRTKKKSNSLGTWRNVQDGPQLPLEVSILSPALVGAETAPRDRRVQVADESITVILFEYGVKCPLRVRSKWAR